MELDQFRDVDLVIDRANDSFVQKQFVSQGDYKGRTLTIQVTNNGNVGEVPGLTLNLNWHNESSGLTDLSAFTVINKSTSVFGIEYPQHMMTPGKVYASIQVIQNGKVTNLKQFELTVQRLAGQAVGIVEKAEYSALVAVLADSNKFRTDLNMLEQNKADISFVEKSVEQVQSGFIGEFANLSILTSTYPSGKTGYAVIFETVNGQAVGYMYTWKNGQWTKGNVFNSNVVAEGGIGLSQTKTEIVGYAEYNLTNLVYEQGAMNASGTPTTSNGRIRSTNTVLVGGGATISVSGSEFMIAPYFYSKDVSSLSITESIPFLLKSTTWGTSFNVDQTSYVRLLVKKSTDASILPTEFNNNLLDATGNRFKKLPNEVIPLEKVSGTNGLKLAYPSSSIHMSFDDVKFCLVDLMSNKGIYTSIFDNPFLAKLKEYHDKFNAKFSLYVFLSEWMAMDNTYQRDFSSNSSWLKFGLHLNENYSNYQHTTYEQAKSDYNNFITKLFEVTENMNCVDRLPRLQNFSFNEVTAKAMKESNGGVLGFLTADDNRKVTYLGDANEIELRKRDSLYDPLLDMCYFSTDLRLENVSDVYNQLVSNLKNAALADMNRTIVVFSHEYVFYNSSFAMLSTAKMDALMKFSSDFGIGFDFPQNKILSTRQIAPVTYQKAETINVTWVAGSFSDNGSDESGTANRVRTNYLYFKDGSKLKIKIPNNLSIKIATASNKLGEEFSAIDYSTAGGTKEIQCDGKKYFRFEAKDTEGTITVDSAANILFELIS